MIAGQLEQLDQTARAARGNLPPGDKPLSQSFACDVLSNESIKSAIAEILAFWPNLKVGTACYNASIRKRGPFLEQRQEQIEHGVQGSM